MLSIQYSEIATGLLLALSSLLSMVWHTNSVSAMDPKLVAKVLDSIALICDIDCMILQSIPSSSLLLYLNKIQKQDIEPCHESILCLVAGTCCTLRALFAWDFITYCECLENQERISNLGVHEIINTIAFTLCETSTCIIERHAVRLAFP